RLNIPSYLTIVKLPMDLGTMRAKIDDEKYETADDFLNDFKLMMRNCFAFNAPGTPTNAAGLGLQNVLEVLWQGLPPSPAPGANNFYTIAPL
ncbi:Bromodomain-containing protein, partial [Favolaschia claudopus]